MLDKMSNFTQRLAVSGVGIVFLIFLIYMSPFPFFRPVFAFVIAALICGAAWEFFHLAKLTSFQPLETLGIIASAAYALATFLATQDPKAEFLPDLVLLLSLASAFAYFFAAGKKPLINIALTLFCLAYLAIPLSCSIRIDYFFPLDSHLDGRWWLLYLLVVTKMTDTGAYIVGKKWGAHKMAPYISPKKTWEGAIGGFIAGLGGSIALYFAGSSLYEHSPLGITLPQSIWLGALLSVVSQFGDLSESLLKRDLGVKDSNQLPGLGGLLDILDSLVFTTPLVYLFLKVNFSSFNGVNA